MGTKKEFRVFEEKLRMTIELADNGIILRNPYNEDEVTLAMEKGEWTDCIDHSDEYKAIGRKIYDYLVDVVLPEQDPNVFITTGFALEIKITPTGRKKLE